MKDSEKLSVLIGDIYDAALDPALWMGVLEKSARFVGGPAASFFTRDAIHKRGNSSHYFGTDPQYKDLYFNRYFELDPLNKIYLLLDVGDVVSCSNLISQAEFTETRFYEEWARPQGIVDNVVTLLDKSPASAAGFVVFRHKSDGLADEGARDRMRLLVPHVRRAALIGKIIDLKTLEAAAFSDVLDGIAAGTFLVDTRGRMVHANGAGKAILATGDVLHLVGGRLEAIDVHTNEGLAETLTASANGDIAVGTKGIALPLVARDGGRYIAHILPLTSGERRKAGAEYSAAAAVFVRNIQIEAPSRPELIAKHYGLTPGEVRVLLVLFESGGVADIAAALGISEATTKTHLRRLFEKTGTRRQADLVKLVAGFAASDQ